jgi:hypothetical protein
MNDELTQSPPTIETFVRAACDHQMSVVEASARIREIAGADALVQQLVRALFKVVETPCMSDDHRQAMNAAAGLLSRCQVKR